MPKPKYFSLPISLILISLLALTLVSSAWGETISQYGPNDVNPETRRLAQKFQSAPKSIRREVMLACRETVNVDIRHGIKSCLIEVKHKSGEKSETRKCFQQIPQPERQNFINCAMAEFTERGY